MLRLAAQAAFRMPNGAGILFRPSQEGFEHGRAVVDDGNTKGYRYQNHNASHDVFGQKNHIPSLSPQVYQSVGGFQEAK